MVLSYWFILLQKQNLQGSKKRACFLFQDQGGLSEIKGKLFQYRGRLSVLSYWFILLQKQNLQGLKKRACFLFQDQGGLSEIKGKLFQYRGRLSALPAGQTFQECLKKEDFMLMVTKMNLFHPYSKSSLYIRLQRVAP